MAKINLENGKYTVVDELSEGGGFYALRYGEKWRNLAGDKLIAAMYAEIERLRKALSIIESKAIDPVNAGADGVVIDYVYEIYLHAKEALLDGESEFERLAKPSD